MWAGPTCGACHVYSVISYETSPGAAPRALGEGRDMENLETPPALPGVDVVPTQLEAMKADANSAAKSTRYANNMKSAVVASALAIAASAIPFLPVIAFAPPSISLWCELLPAVGVACAIGAVHSCLLWPRSRALTALSCASGTASLLLPFVVPLQYGLPKMGLGICLLVSHLKLLECVAGSAPPAVFASRRHLAAHLAFLVEFKLRPSVVIGKRAVSGGEVASDGKAASGDADGGTSAGRDPPLVAGAATPTLWLRSARSLLETMATLCALSTLFHPAAFAESAPIAPPPFGLLRAAAAAGLTDAWTTALHAGGTAALRSYGAVWTVYANLRLSGDGLSLGLLALGFEPTTLNRAPLTTSSSPIDFWSRRWNLVIKGLFHRTIFRPLRARGVPAAAASLLAFAFSGVIHEYIAAPASQGKYLGWNLLFFICQALVCSVEALLVTRGFRVPPAWLASERPGGPVRAALTTALLLPTAFLFMMPLQAGHLLEEMLMLAPRIVIV